jgi:tRNA (adenine22-N1)-methyltransferase
MAAPVLSRRLETLLAMLRPCGVLADVCSDHALLALGAVARGLAGRAIAIDLNAAPLAAAAANVDAAGMGSAVSLRQGDGLRPLAPGEAEAVVLAGIGAQLAVRLLEAAPDQLASTGQLIVQPNQQPERVRAWAVRMGWHLTDETVVAEDGRYFHVLAFHPGAGPDPAYAREGFTPAELVQLGPGLIDVDDADTRAFLRARVDRLAALLERHPTPALRAEHALWARAAARG